MFGHFLKYSGIAVVIFCLSVPIQAQVEGDSAIRVSNHSDGPIHDTSLNNGIVPEHFTDSSSHDGSGKWNSRILLKSNLAGLGLAIANAGAEIDIRRHLSFSLPVYYSCWNYLKETRKYRTAAIQPELRYWLSRDNDGLYAGTHFGIGHYNVATDGAFRIQDHNGTSPAWGGGLSLGFRLPVSRNKKWKMEFAVGYGVYKVHHDKFRNQHNGLLVSSEKKTYTGLDQAALSLGYSFDLKRRGGTE